MKLSDIAAQLNVPCTQDAEITGICIDSRKIQPGQLFVALKGENFDGHDFIEAVASAGAVAIICQNKNPRVQIEQWVVPDAVAALATLASYHRAQIDCQVVALTGSNGKTSVKEMIAAILPKPSFATPGNLNNHIGVPLSMFQLQSNHRFAVFELGANHPGEIAHTVAIVKPDVTLINNIAPAHIAGFGSIDGVANAKGEIHQGLASNGIAVVNDDDGYAHFWDEILASHQVLRFSTSKPSDVYAESIHFNPQGFGQFVLVTPVGRASIALQVPGRHNISNALAAAACTSALGIDVDEIAAGLNRFGGVAGRMTLLSGKSGVVVIDDTYNANLRSVLSGLEVLANYPGKRIFIFGDMGELGNYSKAHHEEVGVVARKLKIDAVYTCGTYSAFTAEAFGEGASHYPSQTALVDAVLPHLERGTTVLVKGSRSAGMEKIVQQLC